MLLKQPEHTASAVMLTACSANAVLRTACSESAVVGTACSTDAVVCTACSANVVLDSACSASAVLRTACSTSAVVGTAVNGKLVAASEGGWRRKLASMAQRIFAAGASHPLTSANRWTSRVIPIGTMYVLTILYLSPIVAVVSQRINRSFFFCASELRFLMI